MMSYQRLARLVTISLLLTVGLVSGQQQNRERVRAEVRRTAELIAQFTPIVNSSGIPEAQQLWRIAQSEQATAESHFGRGRYRLAARFTLAAREHGKSALRLVRQQSNPERINRELDRTDALLERVSVPIDQSKNSRGRDLLNRARRWQSQSRTHLRSRQFGRALKLTFAARDLALRAWETVRSGPDLAEQAIAEANALISEWSAVIEEAATPAATALLNQAKSHLANAQTSFAQGQYQAALADAGLARRLLNRAVEIVQEPKNP